MTGKHKYTPEEAKADLIADLEVDIHCAERDGLPEYAEQCRNELAKLRQEGAPEPTASTAGELELGL